MRKAKSPTRRGWTSRSLVSFSPARISFRKRDDEEEDAAEAAETGEPIAVVPSAHRTRIVAIAEEGEDMEVDSSGPAMPAAADAASDAASKSPIRTQISRSMTQSLHLKSGRNHPPAPPEIPKVTHHDVPLTRLSDGRRLTPTTLRVTLDRSGSSGGPCVILWAQDVRVEEEDHASRGASSRSVREGAAAEGAAAEGDRLSEGDGKGEGGAGAGGDASSAATNSSLNPKELQRKFAVLKRKGYSPLTQGYTAKGKPLERRGSSFGRLEDGALSALRLVQQTVKLHDRMVLSTGSCLLYTFPRVKTAEEPGGTLPTEQGVEVLNQILLHLAKHSPIAGTPHSAFDLPDPVSGSRPKPGDDTGDDTGDDAP